MTIDNQSQTTLRENQWTILFAGINSLSGKVQKNPLGQANDLAEKEAFFLSITGQYSPNNCRESASARFFGAEQSLDTSWDNMFACLRMSIR